MQDNDSVDNNDESSTNVQLRTADIGGKFTYTTERRYYEVYYNNYSNNIK